MSESRLRIGRIVGFGLLAEIATAVIIIGALSVYVAVVPRSDDVSTQNRVAAILGPGLGILFTYIAAFQAAKPVPDRARQHGILVGVVTSVLTIPGMFAAAPGMLPVYIGAVVLKLAAGWAAGAQLEWKGREA
jgi:hypothetical protein